MIKIGRSLIALPAALIAAFVAHLFMGVAFGMGHGFEAVAQLWEAPDMASMPIGGTYIILVTRAVTLAAFVSVLALLVPAYNKQVAVVAAATVIALGVALFLYVAYKAIVVGPPLSFGAWYRNALEAAGIISGGVAGIAAWQSARSHA
ncbi:MAG: hypothetical protein Q8Q73_04380 [Stagnimonas sp.]|nr:hypothetical protein [Stagnimonas sp.]